MKKLIALLICLMICTLCAACAPQEAPPVEDNTTQHTIPPTEQATIEPEWAEVDCDITLVNSKDNTVILYSEDFETFAVVGTNDDDSYILLKLTADATSVINSYDELTDLQVVVNGDIKIDVVIKPETFTGELSIGSDMSYSDLCDLAGFIRGLY